MSWSSLIWFVSAWYSLTLYLYIHLSLGLESSLIISSNTFFTQSLWQPPLQGQWLIYLSLLACFLYHVSVLHLFHLFSFLSYVNFLIACLRVTDSFFCLINSTRRHSNAFLINHWCFQLQDLFGCLIGSVSMLPFFFWEISEFLLCDFFKFIQYPQNSYFEFLERLRISITPRLVTGNLFSKFGEVICFWMFLMPVYVCWCLGIEELSIYSSLCSLALFVPVLQRVFQELLRVLSIYLSRW